MDSAASQVRPNGAYSSEDARRRSIEHHWYPSYLPAEQLAQSGFYAVADGSGTATCFACGLRVTQWHWFCDAWTPHALYSPDCPHLLERRGPEFVRQVMQSELHRHLHHHMGGHRQSLLALRQVFGSRLVMAAAPAALGDAGSSAAAPALMTLLAQQLGTGALQLHPGQPPAAGTALQSLAAAAVATPTQVRDARGCSVIDACGRWPKALPEFENDSGDGCRSGDSPVAASAMRCKICLEARLETVLQPCCHACSCLACLDKLMHYSSPSPTCPVCRANIVSVIMLNLS